MIEVGCCSKWGVTHLSKAKSMDVAATASKRGRDPGAVLLMISSCTHEMSCTEQHVVSGASERLPRQTWK